MGSFFSSNARTEPPPGTPSTEAVPENRRPLPSPTSSIEARPQKRVKVQQPSTENLPALPKVSPVDLSKYTLKKLAFGSEAGATELPTEVESVLAGKEEGAPVDLSKQYVWYASYGSNLLQERFMCYVQGGKIESLDVSLTPCSDAAPPTAIEAFVVPHRLFFAHQKTVTWGVGGVSFITSKETKNSTTIVRAYRITLQQFNEVARKENSASAPVGSVHVSPEDLVRLRLRDEKKLPHNDLDCVITKGKYRTIKYLGDYQGDPVLTFTASHKEQEEVESGHVPLTPPSETYRACIVRGLVQLGLSEEDAQKYVAVRAVTPLLEATD